MLRSIMDARKHALPECFIDEGWRGETLPRISKCCDGHAWLNPTHGSDLGDWNFSRLGWDEAWVHCGSRRNRRSVIYLIIADCRPAFWSLNTSIVSLGLHDHHMAIIQRSCGLRLVSSLRTSFRAPISPVISSQSPNVFSSVPAAFTVLKKILAPCGRLSPLAPENPDPLFHRSPPRQEYRLQIVLSRSGLGYITVVPGLTTFNLG